MKAGGSDELDDLVDADWRHADEVWPDVTVRVPRQRPEDLGAGGPHRAAGAALAEM